MMDEDDELTYSIYMAATKTTSRPNMLPETEFASDFFDVSAAGAAVGARDEASVAERVALLVVFAFSNRMCGE